MVILGFFRLRERCATPQAGLSIANIFGIGIIAKLTPEVSLYGQYARGFRSPPYDDAAIAFTNFAFGYTVLPNANLKPETSDSYELGLRYNSSYVNAGLTGFYNHYNNFIDTVNIGSTFISGRTFSQFQSQNIKGADIYGLEAKAEYRLSGKPQGLNLFASLAYAQGNNLETNQPLDSVEPLKAIIGIGYRAPENRWGTQLFTTLVSAKDKASSATQFKPSGYTNVDLLGYYNFNPSTTLNIGIFNLKLMFVSIDLLTLEPNKFNVTVLYKCASCVSPEKVEAFFSQGQCFISGDV
jgi:hemoglobin/transferrin/lactoferrin receptor protein